MKTREEQLQELVDTVKKESFTGDYKASNREALGILISTYLQWDGHAILEASMLALENANFHSEASKILTMLNHLEDQIKEEKKSITLEARRPDEKQDGESTKDFMFRTRYKNFNKPEDKFKK
jgi:hypothetical protein